MKVNFSAAVERLDEHAAADIHPDDIRNDLVAKVAGEAYDTAGPCVYIRHDADLASAERADGHQPADLLQGCVLDVVSEDFHVVSFYRFHNYCILWVQI